MIALLCGLARAARLAVVIGISDYASPGIEDLEFGTTDATALADYLRGPGGYASVTLLTDRAATREAILTALARDLPRTATPSDEVTIYYSGHGAVEADLSGEEGDGYHKFLVPADADPANLLATAIDMRDLARYLGWVQARSVLTLIDSCYSGGVGARGLGLVATGGSAAGALGNKSLGHPSVPTLAAPATAAGSGRAMLLAAGPNQVSLELRALGHGLFTSALLDGLRGDADTDVDGSVTVTELNRYVHDEVVRMARSVNVDQEPVFLGSLVGDMVVARSAGVTRDAATQERARIASASAALAERDAAMARHRELSAAATALANQTDASTSATPAEKIRRWEELLRDYPDAEGVAHARERLAWLRSANRSFLDVDSNVAAAELLLDGVPAGTAPRTLTDVSVGHHRLVVQKHGYHPWQADVDVPSVGLTVHPVLQPAFGTLSVASDPPGAAVFLGDVKLGVTPLVADEVASGPLQLLLRLDRYAPLPVLAEVSDGRTTVLHPVLTPTFGWLDLVGAPAGASVTIDGRVAGLAPLPPKAVDAGPFHVVVSAPARAPWAFDGTAVAGEHVRVEVPTLAELRGTLTLISEPRGAAVRVDGRAVGTAPLTLPDVAAGGHRVDLSLPGLTWSGTVEVAADIVTSKTVALRVAHPGMIPVEAGTFLYGTATRPVALPAYSIDQTEVSNGAWGACVAAGACPPARAPSAFLRDDLPVVGVTWAAAQGYCRWAGGRLPTDEEWERAARGVDGRAYPWGDAFDPRAANGNDRGAVDGFALTAPVRSFVETASPIGALNMAGNALEWTATPFGAGYAVRGGGATMEGGPEGLKTTSRFAVPADAVSEGIGFRCAAEGG